MRGGAQIERKRERLDSTKAELQAVKDVRRAVLQQHVLVFAVFVHTRIAFPLELTPLALCRTPTRWA